MSDDPKQPTDPTVEERIDATVRTLEEAAKGGILTKDNAREFITNIVEERFGSDPELKRNFMPGQGGDEDLEGTPYAGLSVVDLQFLHALKSRLHAQRPEIAGPSDQLENATQRMVKSSKVGGHRIHNTLTPEFGEEHTGEQVLPLWEAAYQGSTIMQAFNTVRMTAKKLRVPVPTSLPEAYVTKEASSGSGRDSNATSRVGSKEIEAEPTKVMLTMSMSGELLEDGEIVDALPFYTRQARRSISLKMGETVIRGDNTIAPDDENINNFGVAIPQPNPNQWPAYTAYDGLHHAFVVDNAANRIVPLAGAGGAIVPKDILRLRPLMTDDALKQAWGFAGSANDRFLLVDYATANFMLTWDEVKTVDLLGAAATIITGQLGSIWGIRILTDPCIGLYGQDGIFDAITPANNTHGILSLVNRLGFINGARRSLTMETERIPREDRTDITFSWRQAFVRHNKNDPATIEAVAGIVGINPTIAA